MIRTGIVAAMAAFACLSTFTPVTAAPLWSIGGAIGGGSYSNDRFNNSQPSGSSAVRSGHEFGASLRCDITSRWAVEVEATRMRGSATNLHQSPGILPPRDGGSVAAPPALTIQTEETAVPLNVIMRFAGTRSVSLRALVGGGLLTGARWRTTWPGELEQSSKSVTRPYAQLGLETGWQIHEGFQVTGRVLGRVAQANHVLDAEGGDLAIDHTGLAFALGARFGLSL